MNKDYREIIDGDGHTVRYIYDHESHCNISVGRLNSLKWHCIGEPALIYNDYYGEGYIQWWVNDICYNNVIEYCEACEFDKETTVYWVLKYGDELPEYKKDL